MRKIYGTIKKWIFRNEKNGYTIADFQLEDKLPGITIPIIGTFFKVEEGEYFCLHGEYELDKKFGKQFKVDHYESCLPHDLKTLQEYLGSGIIKGVGKVRAQAIIDKFGENTISILENESERLTEIEGIGKRTAELIGRSMTEKGEMQDIMFQLSKYGIGPETGKKIYKTYKKDTLRILQTNPYKLVDDVRGIAFSKADKIALNEGVQKDSPYRIFSGIQAVLKERTMAGDTYCPRKKLLELSEKLLEVESALIEEQLELALENKKLMLAPRTRIYSLENYKAETEAADFIKTIINAEKKPKLNSDILRSLNGNLDEQQMDAVKTAAKSNMMILTGGPGVGKTTTTNLIIQYFEKCKKKVLLAAPTGRAAKRMNEATGREAKTIHRLLEINKKDEEDGFHFFYNQENPLHADVVIIDEVSMLDIFLARALFAAIRPGTQLILVGDKDQLPSVGAGNVLGDIIKSGICPVAKLEKVYRQSEGSYIIENAYRILRGEELVLSKNNKDFFFKTSEDPTELKELLLHYVVDSLPAFTNEKDIQVLAPLKSRMLGTKELNIALQNRINPRNGRAEIDGFRVNDKVIQTRNDYRREKCWKNKKEEGVFNGDAGIITRIDMNEEYVYVKYEDGGVARYDFDELDSLTHSYALTIHKSQGSEYPVVVVPIYDYIPMLVTRNLLYTAVTRAKKAILLIGSRKKLSQIIRNVSPTKRNTGLTSFLKK